MLSGVGLFFERTLYNGSLFPVVKEITEKGSAYREGSIKTGAVLLAVDGRSCRDITLNDLKSLVAICFLYVFCSQASLAEVVNIFSPCHADFGAHRNGSRHDVSEER